MAAANTDKFKRARRKFTTTLNGAISSGVTTLTLHSVTGLDTDTAIVLTVDAYDAGGTATPVKEEVMVGVVSGSNVTNLVRGKEGTTAQAHADGAVVTMYFTETHWDDLVVGLLVEHNQDGTHAPFTSPQVITSINDTNDNELLKVTATASAVDEFTLANAATGGAPSLTASGGDANISGVVKGKGTGKILAALPVVSTALSSAGVNTSEASLGSITIPAQPVACTVIFVSDLMINMPNSAPSWLFLFKLRQTDLSGTVIKSQNAHKSAATGVNNAINMANMATDALPAATSRVYVATGATDSNNTNAIVGTLIALVVAA